MMETMMSKASQMYNEFQRSMRLNPIQLYLSKKSDFDHEIEKIFIHDICLFSFGDDFSETTHAATMERVRKKLQAIKSVPDFYTMKVKCAINCESDFIKKISIEKNGKAYEEFLLLKDPHKMGLLKMLDDIYKVVEAEK